jgi:hypothetical protein
MAKIWVLDTDTKGTGAQMVPLEKALESKAPAGQPVARVRKRRPRPPKPPEPKQPSRFKVVDVVTRQVLAEDATARVTIDVLKDVRSIVDVDVSVWVPESAKWRRLTLGEQRSLWALRDR